MRQLLVAAEPYRSTVPPANPCAEVTAPRTRSDLLRNLLSNYGGDLRARYLEIGCDEDATFGRIASGAYRALCVDPKSGGTHRMTSDDFFASVPESRGPFDVVFVDGLHEAQQVPRLPPKISLDIFAMKKKSYQSLMVYCSVRHFAM